jgi:hypothetical protein
MLFNEKGESIWQCKLCLYNIPAMSAETERLFSSYKCTILDRRNRLGIEAIEAIECLKSWLRVDPIAFIDKEEPVAEE